MTITEFLLARIAEDEAAARNASHHSQLVHDYERDNYGHLWVKTTRVLTECEAKRRIVEACTIPLAEYGVPESEWRRAPGDREDVLHHLAAVYADHPDYDEAWRL